MRSVSVTLTVGNWRTFDDTRCCSFDHHVFCRCSCGLVGRLDYLGPQMSRPRKAKDVIADCEDGRFVCPPEDVAILISRIQELEDQWENHYCEDYVGGDY